MNIPKEIINNQGGQEIFYKTDELFILIGHSAAIGLVLCLITYFTNRFSEKEKNTMILTTSNIMYLSTGLTAIMILVNNNLARAFSIGAAIALVRFRVNLGNKGATANILFAIIAGLACGLDEVRLAWIMTGFYFLISFGTYLLVKDIPQEEVQKLPDSNSILS